MDNMNIGQIALVSLGIISASVVLVLADKKRRSPEKSYKNHAMNMMLVIPRAGAGLLQEAPDSGECVQVCNAQDGVVRLWGFWVFRVSLMLITAVVIVQQYTNLGFISAHQLNMTFVRRLKMIEYLKQVPRVLSNGVPGPVFVMGLP